MTKLSEVGEQWIESLQGECSSFDRSEAEFWIRAFVAEVDKRAAAADRRPNRRQNYNDLIASAFYALTSELLGPQEASDAGRS